VTLTVRPISIKEAHAFMVATGYVPLREGSVEGFLHTAVGDDLQMVEEGPLRLLVVSRHNPRQGQTFIRMVVKQGGGDGAALLAKAMGTGSLPMQPVVTSDAPVGRVREKWLALTQGATTVGPQTVVWSADLTPFGGQDV
jgi:hypothetical protein